MSFAAITAIVALHEHPARPGLASRRDEGWPAKAGRLLLGLVLTGLAVEIALIADRAVPFPQGRPLRRARQRRRHSADHLRDHAAGGARLAVRPGRPRRALLVAGRAGAVAAARPRPRRRRAPGAVALAPRHAARRLRADGRRRPLALPVADRAGAAGAWPRSRLGALWALLDPGAGPDRHRRRPPPRLAHAPRAGSPCSAPAPAIMSATRSPKRAAPSPISSSSSACRPPPAARIFAPPTSTAAAAAGASSPPARAISCAGRRWSRACAEADIVVADRPLPRACAPRWLRADPVSPAPHRRPRDHARRAPRRDGRRAGRAASLGRAALGSARADRRV